MAEVAASTGATVLVIAIAGASGTAIRDLTAQAESCGLIPKVVPSVSELLTGSACIEGVRDPRISDLLGRRPVRTDVAAVAGHFAGKRILVTGAGGSIGSELCRQLHRFGPAELILLDRDESALHAIQLALHGRALLDSDETDPGRHPRPAPGQGGLRAVPPADRLPRRGAQASPAAGALPGRGGEEQRLRAPSNVLEAAAACGVESFVNISTDKAADPVSVLGYSKRIAERLTAHMAGQAAGQLPERPLRQRAGQPRLRAHRPVRAGRRGRPGHRDPSRGDPLLHDRGRGGPARPAGRRDRRQRRGPGARHGRAGAHRRHRPQAGRAGTAAGRHRLHRPAAGREAGRGPPRAG